jgi:NAD(P) transhydrogenase
MRYDLVVIGSDPAAQSGAIAAARLDKRVALIEQKGPASGKASSPSAAVSSRILRDAVRFLTEDRVEVTMYDLKRRVQHLVDRESYAIHDRLDRSEVDLYRGSARFVRPHDVVVHTADGDARLEAERILIACGTRPLRPKSVPFDGRRVFDVAEFLELETLPQSLIVVGAGVTGLEQAILLATLGVRVTVVDGGDRLLEDCDRDVADMLLSRASALGMTFLLGEEVIGIDNVEGEPLVVHFAGGERLAGENILYAAGRVGATEGLDLSAAGLESDERGRLWCNDQQRTWAAHIFGAGDVVGFPVLTGTAADQGRRAVFNAFGQPFEGDRLAQSELQTIPAVAMVGKTGDQLIRERVPHQARVIRMRESAGIRGTGAGNDVIKLLFHPASRQLLGVHCLGETASEVVRVAQPVMAMDGTLQDFCRQISKSPTMAGCCQGAIVEGHNRRRVDQAALMTAESEPHMVGRGFDESCPEIAEMVAATV